MTLRMDEDGVAVLDRNTPLRLLVIEDSLADSELVLAMLEDQLPQADVQVETSLEAAMDRLASQKFDLVLADLSLPDAEGAPVVRAVRSIHPETALIVLTGRADGALALWALAEGAQDYLVKGQQDGPHLATALLNALQRKRAEEEAHRYLELARGLLDALDAPTCAVDSESRIVVVNQAWREFTAGNDGSDTRCGVGVSYLDTCDRVFSADDGLEAPDAAIVAEGIRDVLAGSVDRFRHDYPSDSPNGNRWFSVRVTPADINQRRGAVITHLDITEMHQIQRSVAHQSLHDTLTDLPNMVLMLDRIEQAISDADRRGLGVAVTQLDLHRYQLVNDRLGYRGGDAALVQVAERLAKVLGPSDTLARSSGDEFLVLWRDLDRDRPDEAIRLSQGLVDALDGAFGVADVSVTLSATAGVAWHVPGQSADELLLSADTAIHEAKSQGPGHVVLFTDEMRAATGIRRSLEVELRHALSGAVTEFVLHYQPIVDLTSGKAVAVEALVRWQHPVRGLMGPDRFIPIAEATGLIHPLGDWVLDQAFRDIASLTHEGRELDLALNVSARQLDDRIVAKVRGALESSGLRPGRCILEVTESAFVEDEEMTASTLEGLSALGIQIAIDDFGTGYSSLLYLRRYPIDILKIDRAFVAGIGRSGEDEAICRSITSLAAAVGASSVGEGVETAEQYAVLRSKGCRHGQGFLWSPAVPIDQLGTALAACDRVPVPRSQPRMTKTFAALDPRVETVMATMQAEGASLHTIAAALNRTVGLHPKGVRWTAGAVARGLSSLSGTEPDGPRSGRALGDRNGSDADPTPMERPA